MCRCRRRGVGCLGGAVVCFRHSHSDSCCRHDVSCCLGARLGWRGPPNRCRCRRRCGFWDWCRTRHGRRGCGGWSDGACCAPPRGCAARARPPPSQASIASCPVANRAGPPDTRTPSIRATRRRNRLNEADDSGIYVHDMFYSRNCNSKAGARIMRKGRRTESAAHFIFAYRYCRVRSR